MFDHQFTIQRGPAECNGATSDDTCSRPLFNRNFRLILMTLSNAKEQTPKSMIEKTKVNPRCNFREVCINLNDAIIAGPSKKKNIIWHFRSCHLALSKQVWNNTSKGCFQWRCNFFFRNIKVRPSRRLIAISATKIMVLSRELSPDRTGQATTTRQVSRAGAARHTLRLQGSLHDLLLGAQP